MFMPGYQQPGAAAGACGNRTAGAQVFSAVAASSQRGVAVPQTAANCSAGANHMFFQRHRLDICTVLLCHVISRHPCNHNILL